VQPLAVGLVLGRCNPDPLLETLAVCDRLTVSGMAFCGKAEARRFVETHPDVAMFDDPREMILRTKPRLVFLWGHDASAEYIHMAVDQGTWVCVRPPVAGSLQQAARIYDHTRSANTGVFCWLPWVFLDTYRACEDWLAYDPDDAVAAIFARWIVPFAEQEMEPPGYRFAGADLAYAALHVMHRWLSLPLEVHCWASSPEGRLHPGKAGGGCSVALRHANGQGAVHCLAAAHEIDRSIIFQTEKGAVVVVSPSQGQFYAPDGQLLDSCQMPSQQAALKQARLRCLETIWQAVMEHQVHSAIDMEQNLQTLAILQAAGISARTGQAERLDRVANVADVLAGQ